MMEDYRDAGHMLLYRDMTMATMSDAETGYKTPSYFPGMSNILVDVDNWPGECDSLGWCSPQEQIYRS